ncbi:hypothetical protein ACN47E_003011 [Coniothyrium glycines]
MDVPIEVNHTSSLSKANPTTLLQHVMPEYAARVQMDGSNDHHYSLRSVQPKPGSTQPFHPQHPLQHRYPQQAPHGPSHTASVPIGNSRARRPPQNAVTDLLPFCTLGAPLNEAQVIALSDVVGSLKELALVALTAASGDRRSLARLESAVGQEAVNIVEFFTEEWEVTR